jgi:hypothetical protein
MNQGLAEWFSFEDQGLTEVSFLMMVMSRMAIPTVMMKTF